MKNHQLILFLFATIMLAGCHTSLPIPLAATPQPTPSQTATVPSLPSQIAILSTATPLPRITPTETSDALILLQNMKQQYDQSHLLPGWIHLVAKHSSDIDNKQMLFNANPRVEETYLHLNEDRKVFEGIYFTKAFDGQVVGTGVLKDSQWYDLTEGEVTRRDIEPSTPDLYWGAVWNFERYTSDGNKLDYQQTTFNGEPALLFTVHVSSPFTGDEYNLPAKSSEMKAYFTPEGKILQIETTYTLSDGSVRFFNKAWDFVVETQIAPPADILELLK